MGGISKVETRLIAAAALLAAAIFFLDLSLPLGVAGGVPYVALVLLGWWFEKTIYIFLLGAVASVLTIAGLYFSPEGGVQWVVLTNRFLALFAIWVTTALLARATFAHQKALSVAKFPNENPHPVLRVTEEGSVLYANDAAHTVAGLLAGPGQSALAEELAKEIREVLNSGKLKEIDFAVGGRTLALVLAPVPGESYLNIYGRDITERKRLEGKLLQKERLAILGQLAATISHELRNPLGVIQTSNFVVRDNLKDCDPRVGRSLERIEHSVIRCDRIIDEILDFTRIRQLEMEPTPIDTWLVGVLKDQTLHTDISLRSEFGLPGVKVFLDHDRFRRAVINVFDNACQAMVGDGNGKIEEGEHILTIRTGKTNGRIEVVFEDNGSGIPPDVFPKIFEPMFSTKSFGVGLGMPVVKQIMEQHGGGIEIETEEDRGTKVCLWLDTKARTVGATA